MQTKVLRITKDDVINVTEDTQFVLLPAVYDSDQRINLDFVFEKEGVSAELLMVYALPVKGILNITTCATHKVPHTSCLTKVRGVLRDESVSNYIGKIVIDKKAQQTSSFLNDDVLVVGKNTKNNSQPILMIDADDVKASHGATTGRINENDIYYLSSRALSRNEAERLIVQGFFAELIEEIKDESVRKEVLENIGEVEF
jgi:Fe-S cluster assembly protein SufD